jgi:hypothetical protein
LLDNLKNADPDYVVDVLDISTDELLKRFPVKLAAYIASEIGQTEAEYDEV